MVDDGSLLSQLSAAAAAGAAEIAPGVGLLAGEDGGLVAVHGLATFAWDDGDEAGRRLAAVQLVRLRAASQGQVAEAFGVDPATLWRWDQALACGRGGRAGPGPPRAEGRVEADARAGGPDRWNWTPPGRRCGRSRRRPGCRRSPSATRWAGSRPAARPRRPRRPQDSVSLISGTAKRRPRASRCRCCRIRCPGTGSGRWPGGGCSARATSWFRRWCAVSAGRAAAGAARPGGTGLLEAARQVYGRLRDGYYGLAATLLTLVFLALAGEPRAEGATRVPPAALGRVLGLDRARKSRRSAASSASSPPPARQRT